MSEEAAIPPEEADDTPPCVVTPERGAALDEKYNKKGQKPCGMKANMERAVRRVLQRKKDSLRPNFEEEAKREGVSKNALKTTVWKVENGERKLSLPEDLREAHIDSSVEMQRTLKLLGELEFFINDALDVQLAQARTYFKRGKSMAYRDLGIPLIIQDLRAVANVRRIKEEGYMAILDKLNQRRSKDVNPATNNIQDDIMRADPVAAHLKAIAALKRHGVGPVIEGETVQAEPPAPEA